MAVFTCIAGLPHDLTQMIDQEKPRFSGSKEVDPIVKPVSGHLSYRHGMEEAFIVSLARRIAALPTKRDVSIVIGYVNYPGQATQKFIMNFFPFALSVPFEPFYVDSWPKEERRSKRLEYLRDVEALLSTARQHVAKVRDSLSGQNFTPLALPVRNFESDVVRPRLTELFLKLWASQDPEASIDEAKSQILKAHPKDRIKYEDMNHKNDLNKPYFLDKRQLRFKSPGNDLHGLRREVEGDHENVCLISSRSRLGGPLLSGLHYDCDYHPRKDVTDWFENCHNKPTQCSKPTHANIAPNDAVW